MEFFLPPTPPPEDNPAEAALQRIETAFEVRLTLHDLRGLLVKPNGVPMLPGRHLHPHVCCTRGRFTETGWNTRCYHDCFTASENRVSAEKGLFFKICWKGAVELVTPVYHAGSHLLTFYAGVFRLPDHPEPPAGAPEQRWFREIYADLPVLETEKLLELDALIQVTGQGFIAMAAGEPDRNPCNDRAAAILRFLRDRAHQPLTLSDLARHLHLSPSRAGHVVSLLFDGSSFQDILTRERMLRARHLLLTTGQKLDEISAAVGFRNCYYFNRAFHKFFGEAPGRFRRQAASR